MRKLKVLHLSDTQLSGSPIRISKLINKYSGKFESRHITWVSKYGCRLFECDLVGSHMEIVELEQMVLDWADIIHYHNRWSRQRIFTNFGMKPPKIPSVIQIHSPRDGNESFKAEAESGLPLAVIAQYHVRQWPELSFVVPNVVDILDPVYEAPPLTPHQVPTVSFAPSNTNARGWDDKGYGVVAPVLKRMKIAGTINFQLITSQPHDITMQKKRLAHIGIDEIVTGSYHLSSLEYLSLGIGTFANIDKATEKVLKDLTGAEKLPWLPASESRFESRLKHILKTGEWVEAGHFARQWMERHWNPRILLGHYERMYEKLVEDFRP